MNYMALFQTSIGGDSSKGFVWVKRIYPGLARLCGREGVKRRARRTRASFFLLLPTAGMNLGTRLMVPHRRDCTVLRLTTFLQEHTKATQKTILLYRRKNKKFDFKSGKQSMTRRTNAALVPTQMLGRSENQIALREVVCLTHLL